jgi:dCMP deaminase
LSISWDEYFLDIAEKVAAKATCPVKMVGAVFVAGDTHSVLSLGYNGAPRKTKHCDKCDGRKPGERSEVCRAVHAELNAIFNAALNGICLRGSDLYITCSPCKDCARAIVQVGAKYVHWRGDYPDEAYRELFNEAGVHYW